MTVYDSNGNDFTMATLRDVKAGEFVTRKANLNKVYIKGAYDRATKRYSLTDTTDHCREIFLKADAIVFIGFTY
jgi:hypothetical protein